MHLLKEIKAFISNNTTPVNWGAEIGVCYGRDLMNNYITYPHYCCSFPIESPYYRDYLIKASEWEDIKRKSKEKPVLIRWYQKKNQEEKFYYYIYKGSFYRSEIELSENEAFLVLQSMWESKNEKLTRELERIKAKAELEGNLRIPISEEVQITVWNRDGGKCVKCGSSLNLEFDHIIPLSKGGSNTARNIQLLCEHCNRSKGAKIGG